MALRLPGPIGEDEIARYSAFLTLAAPQELFLTEAHARYVQSASALIQANIAELDDLNAQAGAIMVEHGLCRSLLAAFGRLYDKQDAVEQSILHADKGLFAELDSILAPQQREHMQRVLDHRARRRCTSMAYRIIRSSQIDISALLEQQLAGEPEVLAQINDALLQYEHLLTPMYVELEQEMRKQDQAVPELMAWQKRDDSDQLLPQDEQVRRSQTMLERLHATLEKGVSLQRGIKALNDRTLSTITAALPPRHARTLNLQYHVFCYPVVYQAHHNANALELCDEVLRDTRLTDVQREALSAICDTYRGSHNSLCTETEEQCDEWQAFYAETRFTLNRYEPYRAKMRDLRQRRWDAALLVMRQIESIMTHGSSARLDESIARLRREIDDCVKESQAPRERYPGM